MMLDRTTGRGVCLMLLGHILRWATLGELPSWNARWCHPIILVILTWAWVLVHMARDMEDAEIPTQEKLSRNHQELSRRLIRYWLSESTSTYGPQLNFTNSLSISKENRTETLALVLVSVPTSTSSDHFQDTCFRKWKDFFFKRNK
jgi:hypothetical protein